MQKALGLARGSTNPYGNTARPLAADNRCYVGVGLDPEHEEGVGHLQRTDLVTGTRLGPENKDNDVSPRAHCLDPTAAVNKDSSLAWHYSGAAEPADHELFSRGSNRGRTLSTVAVHHGLIYAAKLDAAKAWLAEA
jgi:hypothetical protein